MTPAQLRLALASSVLGAIAANASCTKSEAGTGGRGGAGSPASSSSSPAVSTVTSFMCDEAPEIQHYCQPLVVDATTTGDSTASSGAGGASTSTGGTGGAGPANPCPPSPDYQYTDFPCFSAKVIGGPEFVGGQCCYTLDGTYMSCCSMGRPLIIGGERRMALGRRNDEFAEGAAPDVSGTDPGTRSLLARAWLSDALLEHASIASFAKLSIELMSVGAPADLLDEAHAAARDEVDHARRCFAIASAYAGSKVGPGELALKGSVDIDTDLAGIAARTVIDGCVGETLAAAIAAERLASAKDPVIRRTLEIIAEDEARHAVFAYKIVAWAVNAGGTKVRAAVAQAFEEALAEPWSPSPLDDALASADGLAPPDAIRETVRHTIREVIHPAAAVLS